MEIRKSVVGEIKGSETMVAGKGGLGESFGKTCEYEWGRGGTVRGR